MQEEVISFLAFQMRRSSESGDNASAAAQLRQFLELERESKVRAMDSDQDGRNVRRFPGLRSIS